MQPSYISVMNVFTQQTRHTVPLFQRPYVWKKEDQWEPLWNDVKAAAERVLNARLLRDYPERWDESAIATRAASLFDAATSIWPAPAALLGATAQETFQPVASQA